MQSPAETTLKKIRFLTNRINVPEEVSGSSNPSAPVAIMFSPVLKKIEEKVQVKKDEDSKDGSPPPLKKLCTAYTKQLAKLPAGNQGLVKDMSGDW